MSGRVLARARTRVSRWTRAAGAAQRQAIVEALLDLVGRRRRSTAQQLAARARVGIRTVFRRFSDMESLFSEVDAHHHQRAAAAPCRHAHGHASPARLALVRRRMRSSSGSRPTNAPATSSARTRHSSASATRSSSGCCARPAALASRSHDGAARRRARACDLVRGVGSPAQRAAALAAPRPGRRRAHRAGPPRSAPPLKGISMSELVRIMGAPGSPYSRKLRAVLRYRRIPHAWVNHGSPESRTLPTARVQLAAARSPVPTVCPPPTRIRPRSSACSRRATPAVRSFRWTAPSRSSTRCWRITPTSG